MTHYTDREHGRIVPAVCGRFVRLDGSEVDLHAPTCPRCQQVLAEREAEPLPSWAKEAVR